MTATTTAMQIDLRDYVGTNKGLLALRESMTEKAATLFTAQDYTYAPIHAGQPEQGFYVVKPNGDAIYRIELELSGNFECSCPAHRRFNLCKHVIAVEQIMTEIRIARRTAKRTVSIVLPFSIEAYVRSQSASYNETVEAYVMRALRAQVERDEELDRMAEIDDPFAE